MQITKLNQWANSDIATTLWFRHSLIVSSASNHYRRPGKIYEGQISGQM